MQMPQQPRTLVHHVGHLVLKVLRGFDEVVNAGVAHGDLTAHAANLWVLLHRIEQHPQCARARAGSHVQKLCQQRETDKSLPVRHDNRDKMARTNT